MSTPSGDEPESSGAEPQVPFDPYRFGKPDRPIPPEYAPPGYVPEPPPPQPYQSPYQQHPPGQHPYGQQPGQQPYGQYGPGYPGPYPGQAPVPPYQGYEQPRTGNGKAVASMVLGILSILLFWLTVIDGVIIVTSVALGIVALVDSRQRNGEGRGMAIAGLVCSAIGAAAAIVATVWFVHVAGQCGGLENANQPGFKQCFQDHI